MTAHNQQHLTNRHVFMQRTMANLDEQSRVLHQRLTERRSFGYVKERQHALHQALQRHLKISAKFCAATWSRRKQTRSEKDSLLVRLLNIFKFHFIAVCFAIFLLGNGWGHHAFHDVITEHHSTIPRTLEIPTADISDHWVRLVFDLPQR